MTDIAPLSPGEIAELRARHFRSWDGGYLVCNEDVQHWPCDAARLLATVDAQRSEWAAWVQVLIPKGGNMTNHFREAKEMVEDSSKDPAACVTFGHKPGCPHRCPRCGGWNSQWAQRAFCKPCAEEMNGWEKRLLVGDGTEPRPGGFFADRSD